MNASYIMKQLMNQMGGSQNPQQGNGSGQSQGQQGGGLADMVGGLVSQFTSGQSQGQNQGKSGGGLDVGSLLGGGALGLLLGSKRGRSMGGSALKYGAIAGIGMLAYKAWQNRGDGQPEQQGQTMEQLQGQPQEQRSLALLQALIMAARADGHIDEQERSLITEQIGQLGADDEMNHWVQHQLQAPLDAQALAAQADSPQAAREMYLISVAVIDDQNAMERAWLDQLGGALGLGTELQAELERQVAGQ
ncbi:tellurite resistance TerB family protein [Halomonas halocynthiae]|uniref:tellurite resistance TerB family protein n=1 Tax=Halomonas halocynthiae TaxID=176290 RepID=UPI000417547F|nr:tellurite resistance TerB family protein [Halomonas halocynthiae]